jgi:uncharacterized membrane protein YdjX (TVP38/TMEM64 family)
MPADYRSTAEALSLSPNPNSHDGTTDPPPPWVRPRTTTSSRRLGTSTPYARPSNEPWTTRVQRTAEYLLRKSVSIYMSLSPLKRILAAVAALVSLVLSILFIIYSHSIFVALAPIAAKWRALPGGWIILWVFCFLTAFPPMIGYSTSLAVSGFVYGFPLGWPIIATASVAGSTAAFIASRTIFSGYVNGLVGKDHRFMALGQVLRREGLGMLTMIRLCPLPYSISNGVLSTIPSVRPWVFGMATACAR